MSRLPKTPLSYRDVLTTFPDPQAKRLPLDAKWSGPVPLSYDRMAALVTEAHEERARHLRAMLAIAARGMATPFLAAARSWRTWRIRRRDREELAQLDDRALRDIGITRYDALMADRQTPRRD